MPDLKDIKIFISYAREDENYLEDIKRYALRFHNTQRIEIWDDGNLSLGDEWDDEIKKHLNEADIIFLQLQSPIHFPPQHVCVPAQQYKICGLLRTDHREVVAPFLP